MIQPRRCTSYGSNFYEILHEYSACPTPEQSLRIHLTTLVMFLKSGILSTLVMFLKTGTTKRTASRVVSSSEIFIR